MAIGHWLRSSSQGGSGVAVRVRHYLVRWIPLEIWQFSGEAHSCKWSANTNCRWDSRAWPGANSIHRQPIHMKWDYRVSQIPNCQISRKQNLFDSASFCVLEHPSCMYLVHGLRMSKVLGDTPSQLVIHQPSKLDLLWGSFSSFSNSCQNPLQVPLPQLPGIWFCHLQYFYLRVLMTHSNGRAFLIPSTVLLK